MHIHHSVIGNAKTKETHVAYLNKPQFGRNIK
jgi:hypothetical protein